MINDVLLALLGLSGYCYLVTLKIAVIIFSHIKAKING